MIKSVFDIDLPVGGGWGYESESATTLYATDLPLAQLEHTLASMRAHLEMSLMPAKEERYGSINLNESEREVRRKDGKSYHQVTYAVTAMKESQYNAFVDEYKEGYGREDFDLADHFERRKKATLERQITYWFEIREEMTP
jgi:hypothetical protein